MPVTAKTLKIAALLEEAANTKIELAEVIVGRDLSIDEREELYFSDIKDKLGLVFQYCPEINPLVLASALQVEEMMGSKHIYFTVLDNHLDRDPTKDEIRDHYIEKRAYRFRENFEKMMASRKTELDRLSNLPTDAKQNPD